MVRLTVSFSLEGERRVQEEGLGQGEREGQGPWLHPRHGRLHMSILLNLVFIGLIICIENFAMFTVKTFLCHPV